MDDGTVHLPNGKGEYVTGRLHESITVAQARTLVGRTVDLEAAYKNLVRRQSDGAFSIIAVYNPNTGLPELREEISLAFGATGSVHAFNRVSVAIRNLLTSLFKLTVTSFYDDYVQQEFKDLSASAETTMDSVLSLLGWKVSADKVERFNPVFRALGVEFDLSQTVNNKIEVRNTASRIESVSKEVRRILSAGSISSHECSSLKGKTTFCESQHWCRCGSMVTAELSAAASKHGSTTILTKEMSLSLAFLVYLLNSAKPRSLQPRPTERCTYIYVDGSAEGEPIQEVCCAGVLLSPRLEHPEYFAYKVTDSVVRHWQSRGSKQTIGQGELIPVLISKILWADYLQHTRVIWLIDNEASREGLVKSFSPCWSSREILLQVSIQDIEIPALNWYGRVPSAANLADDPSRNKFKVLESQGAFRRTPAEVTVDQLSGNGLYERLLST